jgi:DNA-binding transcriptional MocR family regulator
MDLRLNVPPQPPEAELRERFAQAIGALQSRADFPDLLGYGPSQGRPEDRKAAALWLLPRLGELDPDNVLVCAGGASLLVALATTFASRGDAIVTEALAYPGIRAVCRHFGIPLVGLEMDGEGIVPSALADTCRQVRPKILYCTPTIQNPTTSTMSLARRKEIVDVARRFDLTILEDDAYGMLPEDGPLPLATLAPERTYYIASLSKTVSPGLRIAFCVGPEAVRARIVEGVRVVTLHAPPIMAALASRWIQDGSASAMLSAVRSECVARQAIARQVLNGRSIQAGPAGPHLWLSLPGRWNIPELGAYLRANGIAAKGDGFAIGGAQPSALRIGLGAWRSRDDLVRGLELLDATLCAPPPHLGGAS